jgi:hypothetical protein
LSHRYAAGRCERDVFSGKDLAGYVAMKAQMQQQDAQP